METKLKVELEALPAPATTFENLEALNSRPKTFRRKKGVLVAIAAVLALLLCGMGWTKMQYGMWMLYDSRAWSDLEAEATKHDIRIPRELDGIPFLQMQIYGHVPQGGSLAQALLNPLYKPVCADYGFHIREVSTDGKMQSRYDQDILELSFGPTTNELWHYYFGIDENGRWTACEVPESYHTIEYKGMTLQMGDTFFYDNVKGCNRYTRWVIWVDENKQVAFSLNETDYTDPDRVVECAKAIIDLNRK